MKRNTVNGGGKRVEEAQEVERMRRGDGGSWGQAVLRTLNRLGGEAEGEFLLQESARCLKEQGAKGIKSAHLDVALERLIEAGLIGVSKAGLYRLATLERVCQGGKADRQNKGTTFYSTDFSESGVDANWEWFCGRRRDNAPGRNKGAARGRGVA